MLILKDFIDQTLEFLRKSDVMLDDLDIRRVDLEADGTKVVHIDSATVSGAAEIRQNTVLVIMILFGLVDALVDQLNLNIQSPSFRQRYLALPHSNDREIIFREIYRIMKLFRNAIVHSKNSVSQVNDSIQIDYAFGNPLTNFTMTLPVRTLWLIFTLIRHYARRAPSPYFTAILRAFYDDIRSQISDFSDDIAPPSLFRLNDEGIRLKRGVRYRVKNPVCDVKNNGFKISRHDSLAANPPGAGVEYIVVLDGASYLIPDEALSDSGEISMESLSAWRYEKEPYF